MTLAQAKELHNGDQVCVRASEEIVTVIKAQTTEDNGRAIVLIDAHSQRNGFQSYRHDEVS